MSHTTQKFIHAGLHIIAIAFTSGSLLVIMTFKEVTENQEFFSPHAWLGIASLGGYDLNVLSFWMSRQHRFHLTPGPFSLPPFHNWPICRSIQNGDPS